MKLDDDVNGTAKSLKSTEGILGHKFTIKEWDKIPKMYEGYVQVDADSQSDPICNSSGCTQYKHKKTKRGYDINYGVPNFGADADMMDNEASLNQAQKDLSHDWEFGTKASKAKWKNPAKKVDYNFAPKLDGEIITTDKNLADAQTRLGHKWVIEDVSDYKPNYVQIDEQADAESDPICSSAGCDQYKHPKRDLGYKQDYFVPNFGRDHDINDGFDNLKVAEGVNDHTWNWIEDKKKTKEVRYND